MCKVSILVPIYGVERYIERCARSLFEQTYSNVEFVFVDDCSPDNSVAILERVVSEYETLVDRVTIINHEKNRGLAAARNSAVEAAGGEFVMHVDSDDWIEPTMVEELVKKQLETGADIVSCNAKVHYADEVVVMEEPNYNSKDEMMRSVIQMTMDHVIWRRLIRASLYLVNNIYAVEGVNIGEDHYTLPRLLFYATSFDKCDKALYHYNCLNNDSYLHFGPSSFNYIKYSNNRDSINILIDFFFQHDKTYLDEIYLIKARYVYGQFFQVLKEGEKTIYKELVNDWKSIDNTYKQALGLTPIRIKLLNGNYTLNKTRVISKIVVKKILGSRRYEL